MVRKFVVYLRVSSKVQGRSGLGLEAQREIVKNIVRSHSGEIVKEFVEIASGANSNRRIVAEAIEATRAAKATLVIGKIDRLARDAVFLLSLQKSGLKFIAGDMPDLNTLSLGILATVAQTEFERLSTRQKEIKAVMKTQGRFRGGLAEGRAPKRAIQQSIKNRREDALKNNIEPKNLIKVLRADGLSLKAVAAKLNEMKVLTARGKAWTTSAVRYIVDLYDLKVGG